MKKLNIPEFSIKVIGCGGRLISRSLFFVGYEAENTLNHYHADKAFISCTSVDLDKGLTDTNEEEARIRRVMLDRAVRKILIADTTKFGKVSFASICPLKDIDTVVSDSSLGGEWSVRFQEMGIEHFYKNS